MVQLNNGEKAKKIFRDISTLSLPLSGAIIEETNDTKLLNIKEFCVIIIEPIN